MRFRAFAAVLMVIGLVAAVPSPIVRTVSVTGDIVLAPSELVAHLAVRPGMRYSDAVREKDAESAREFYEAHHLELAVIEGGIVPASIDAKSNTATVKYSVYVARVAAVRVVGSKEEAAVRRLLQLRPGMVLNSELVKADEQRLRATGKFATVNPKIEEGPNHSKPQDITLVWVLGR